MQKVWMGCKNLPLVFCHNISLSNTRTLDFSRKAGPLGLYKNPNMNLVKGLEQARDWLASVKWRTLPVSWGVRSWSNSPPKEWR